MTGDTEFDVQAAYDQFEAERLHRQYLEFCEALERRWYIEVDASQASQTVRDLARATVTFAAVDLGLPVIPDIRWFVKATRRQRQALEAGQIHPSDLDAWSRQNDLSGLARNGEFRIHLSADLDVGQVIRLAAHECRHVWQWRYRPDMHPKDRERDAERYEDHPRWRFT